MNDAPATQNMVTVIARMMTVVPRFGWSMMRTLTAPMMTTNGISPCSSERTESPLEASHAAR